MIMLSKILQTLIRSTHYDPAVLSLYAFSFIVGSKEIELNMVELNVLSQKINMGLSVIRIGDGEAMLMTGRNIHYQKTSPELKKGLRQIVDCYSKESPFILSLPKEGLLSTSNELKKKGRYRIWRLFRCFARVHINPNLEYADAHTFYNKILIESIISHLINDRHVICISNEKTCDRILASYLKNNTNSVNMIITPSVNAFDELDEICTKIDLSIAHSTKKPLLLIAAGPTSKIIAYRYSQKGTQSIDLGHGMEILGKNIDYSSRV